MAPKRRPGAPSSSAQAAAAQRAPAQRASKLAKEHGATAQQEAEIREAYALFCIADPHRAPDADEKKKKQKSSSTAKGHEVHGTVIRTGDVRRCLVALNAPPADRDEAAEILDTLDPEKIGVVAFEHFFAIAAMKVQTRHEGNSDDDEEGGGAYVDGTDEDVKPKRSKGKGRASDVDAGGATGAKAEAEVRAAFGLFTRGEGEMITLAHLRRVARELREEVDDKMLKDMIREANGEGGKPGVGLDEFGDVMTRAGVFG